QDWNDIRHAETGQPKPDNRWDWATNQCGEAKSDCSNQSASGYGALSADPLHDFIPYESSAGHADRERVIAKTGQRIWSTQVITQIHSRPIGDRSFREHRDETE